MCQMNFLCYIRLGLNVLYKTINVHAYSYLLSKDTVA